jgi:hypothetical protein
MADNPATAGLTFLSWYRTGLSAGIAAPASGAALDTPPPAAVVVPVSTTIRDPDKFADTNPSDTATAGIQVRLHAPGDVTGVDPAQIIRIYPTANATNVAPGTFPLIEFARPDIPWMMSPTGPQTSQPTDSDPRRGLMPWLALVVVPEPPATLNPPTTKGALPTLTVTDTELPDPAAAWLWAHAQVTTLSTETQTIPELIAQSPERALSRLMAARYLHPNTPYLACVVPTYSSTPVDGHLGHAWSHSTPPAPQTLPVYYYWRFTTGPEDDFRTLVWRLKHWEQGEAGVRPLDIGHAGRNMPGPSVGQSPWTIGLEGCLVSGDVAKEIGSWSDPNVESAIKQALITQLDGTSGELTPPQYGAVQASYQGQLAGGQGPTWLRTLNLDPRYRAAASLGADLVRVNQEALILSVWDQAGQINAANLVLRQGQLAREAGVRTYTRRIGPAGVAITPLGDDRLLQLTSPVHSKIPAPGAASGLATIGSALATNSAVAAVVSVPFRRMARPRGTLAVRLAAAPLPPPVGNIAKAGGIVPTPALTAVSGLINLTQISQAGAAPETLKGVTEARVATIRFPWEQGISIGAPLGAAPAQTDLLLQPGYLADLWVLGSSIGRALDWDGRALGGWTTGPTISEFTIGPAYAGPGSTWHPTGGAGALINWNVTGTSQDPAVVLASSAIWEQELTGDQGATAWMYMVSIDCTLRGDLIAGVQSPVQTVTTGGVPAWPRVNLTSFSWGPPLDEQGNALPLPPMRIGTAVSIADLTGTGKPSIAIAWSVNCAAPPPPPPTGVYVKILFDVDVNANAAKTIETYLFPDAASQTPEVQGVALANGRLFLLIGGQLMSAAIDGAAGTIGTFTFNIPDIGVPLENWVWATLTAADFRGSGQADLLFFYAASINGEGGAAAYRAAYRIAYELDAGGKPAHWGDEVEAPIPVSDLPTSLVLGPLDPGTSALRRATAQAFRAAAALTQARLTSVIPEVASPPPPPSVDTASLSSAIRTAVDPHVTVPASVNKRLSLPAALGMAAGDQLKPVGFTPSFPQPFYETVRDGALWRLIPGVSSFPDEAIAVLGADSHVIEAILVGANHELSRELLWRGVPALRAGTYFTRFWDGRDANGNPLADITEISSWGAPSDLGSHAPPTTASADLAVLLLRGELIRHFPHATIYAAPAVAAGSSRTVDVTQPVQPLFSGTVGGDSVFVGFPFTVQSAMNGGPDGLGMYFVFQEHPMAPRFGLNLDVGTPTSFGAKPDVWKNLSWSESVPSQAAYDALTYLDTSSSAPLAGTTLDDTAGATPGHLWGFSSAHMAHITYRPPVLIARHADDLLAAASTATTAAGVSG